MTRVVVTGIGCISSLGHNAREFSDNLLAGTSGIGPISLFDTSDFIVKIASEVKGYDEESFFSEKQLSQLDRFTQFALIATREAVRDASIDFSSIESSRASVIHGTGVGGQTTQDSNYYRLYAQNTKRLHPFTVPKLMPSAASSWISMDQGITGPAFSTTSACASAGHAIAMSLMMLRSGMADVAVTGGAEACITPGTIKAWESLRVMAKDTCRPFCRTRGGLVIGEGAGTLILETLEHARSRGAKIYAELKGTGMSADAGSLVQPRMEGAAAAIASALKDSRLSPEDIGYINAHGTGTAQNDPTETAAVRKIFRKTADRLAVSSTKSMHGHTLGASAAIESIATIMALKEQTAPPTANYREPDPACDLDYVPNSARPVAMDAALCNSFAFGGLNTVLVFSVM